VSCIHFIQVLVGYKAHLIIKLIR